ncbi:hypothetical protein XBP1_940001 [Xenorhabdus bovienii str. puntauvense]|uniref:Uncharacterized protein n=1 Tax=Xenorhabdus bovienii str. puntauvense TaxID=1398201 RepID=A0A077NKR9_XENBV|nr:hypothetical protein [Xenorhabdus bovienii]CDG99389.1 hypothetical protein XBP1_940001 [Xenorhabdus bovienii str. puntauvense]
MSGQCIICKRIADKVIGIRLRRELDKLSAIWAPNTKAYLCDEHAAIGYDIDIAFTPRSDKTIKTSVTSGNNPPITRIHSISKPVNWDDE